MITQNVALGSAWKVNTKSATEFQSRVSANRPFMNNTAVNSSGAAQSLDSRPPTQWWIQGRGPPPPLLLDQTEAQKAKKNFFGDRPPPLISGSG